MTHIYFMELSSLHLMAVFCSFLSLSALRAENGQYVVGDVVKGGLAVSLLHPGDILVSCNGKALLGMTLAEVTEVMKSCLASQQPMVLGVRRPSKSSISSSSGLHAGPGTTLCLVNLQREALFKSFGFGLGVLGESFKE